MPTVHNIFSSIERGEPIDEKTDILFKQFMTDEKIEFENNIEYEDFDDMQRIGHYDVFHDGKIVAKYGNPFDIIKEYKIYQTLQKEQSIPNIIGIYKSRKSMGEKYILVCEYIEGITLLNYVRSIGFNIREFEDIMNSVLLELDKLNKKYGFCHYDLHADNILITPKNKIYFIDFEYTYIHNCVPTTHGALYGIYGDRGNISFDILKLCVSIDILKEFKDISNVFVENIEFIDNTLAYYDMNKLTYKDFYNILNGSLYDTYCCVL